MTRLAEGSIIQAGITQIQQNYELTPDDEKLAEELSLYIQTSRKESVSAVGGPGKITESYNWIPVYVKENGIRNYEIVGSPVVLEACKKAGLRIINCLQLDHSREASKQVEYLFEGLKSNGTTNGHNGGSRGSNGGDSSTLKTLFNTLELKLISELKDYKSNLEAKIENLISLLTPPPLPVLFVNEEISVEALLDKLKIVTGFRGEGKTAREVAQAIKNRRPFTSEHELTQAVPAFLKKNKEHSQKFKDLKSFYQIDYSHPSQIPSNEV